MLRVQVQRRKRRRKVMLFEFIFYVSGYGAVCKKLIYI